LKPHFLIVLRSLLLICALWQAGVLILEPPRYIVPSPWEVASVFGRQGFFLLDQSLTTLSEIALGFFFGTALGIATALTIVALPHVGNLIWPMVQILQSFPAFVLAPVLVLWFGFGVTSKVVMTTIIIFFPIASSFADGLRRTDQSVLDAATLTKASHWQTIRYLRAPLALPSLISGLRIAATLAPLGAVIGEWVGASKGLGFVMLQSNARMQTDVTFAAMVLLALMTVSLKLLIDALTPKLAPWASEQCIPHKQPQR
jgi:putative hydroxymethylpyrimidine transport system permease protein